MKKILLAIIIFLLMPFVAKAYNCRYLLSQDQEYSGIECDTLTDENDKDECKISKPIYSRISKIKIFTDDYNVVKVNYGDSSDESSKEVPTSSVSEGNRYHRFSDILIIFDYIQYEDLRNAVNNNNCPKELYLFPITQGQDASVDSKAYICTDECKSGVNAVKYESVNEDPNENPEPYKECTLDNPHCTKGDEAISCRRYSIRENQLGAGKIEFGTLKDGTHYYAVIFNGYTGIKTDSGSDYNLTVDYDAYKITYKISKSFWDSLIIDKCTYKDINLGLQEVPINFSDYEAIIGEKVDENPGIIVPPYEVPGINFCAEARVLQAFRIGGILLFILKILVPLIIVILGVIDFSRAVISTGDKANKEAIMSLAKRFIIGIIIFLLPAILDFLIGLVDGADETSTGFSACTHCLFEPFKCNSGTSPTNQNGDSGSGQHVPGSHLVD